MYCCRKRFVVIALGQVSKQRFGETGGEREAGREGIERKLEENIQGRRRANGAIELKQEELRTWVRWCGDRDVSRWGVEPGTWMAGGSEGRRTCFYQFHKGYHNNVLW